MKALAFGALIRNDEIEFPREEITLETTRRRAVLILRTCELPLGSRLIDRSIGTFWFACAAVDAVARDINRHGYRNGQ